MKLGYAMTQRLSTRKRIRASQILSKSVGLNLVLRNIINNPNLSNKLLTVSVSGTTITVTALAEVARRNNNMKKHTSSATPFAPSRNQLLFHLLATLALGDMDIQQMMTVTEKGRSSVFRMLTDVDEEFKVKVEYKHGTGMYRLLHWGILDGQKVVEVYKKLRPITRPRKSVA